jgi:hypothetical protein
VRFRKAMGRHRALCAAACLVGPATALALASVAAATPTLSNNWAGYVATASTPSGVPFSSISGTWREPRASCTAGRESYSAVWVGLGGDSESARSLEQIGADANCTRTGRSVYSTWFELLPAPPVNLALKVLPGQQVSASVTVRGNRVTLRIRNLTTGARFATTRRASRIDASSADWIVEAPSVCLTAGGCRTLQLADFGQASFDSATATVAGHTGAIGDPAWSATELELRQGAQGVVGAAPGARVPATGTLVLATPSMPSVTSGAFSVSWHEQLLDTEAPPAPTLPGGQI